jgi:two-component system, sensor histidine kinase
VDFASNGQEGIEKAKSKEFDLVLMDIQMPVLDGYSATKELRRLGFAKPIVALSAHAMKEDREKSLAVGCDDHLVKPIDPVKLLQTVARFKGEISNKAQ